MTVEQFGNGGSSPLTQQVTTTPSTGTVETWFVNSTSSFAQGVGQTRAIVDNEIIYIATPPLSSTSFNVSRAEEGTTAATHNVGAAVNEVLTAGALNQLANLSQTASQTFQGPIVVPNFSITGLITKTVTETASSNPSFTTPVLATSAGGTLPLPNLSPGLLLIIKNTSATLNLTISGNANIDGNASRGIQPFGEVWLIGGSTQWWVISGGTYGHPVSTMFMASNTWTVPLTGMYTVFALGGGGGGSGGGSALSTGGVTTQVGGGGGGQGQMVQSMQQLTAGTVLTITVGAGGTGGNGGAVNGNAGASGTDGGNSSAVGTGINLTATGGGTGAHGGANSTTSAGGGSYGSGTTTLFTPTTNGMPGTGGQAFSSSGIGGGVAIGVPGWAGGGGAPASSTLGGTGGTINGNSVATNTATVNGGNGTAQAANSGLGGGGGGGGAPTGTGGNGGNGGSGFVMIMLNP